jgi:cytochrome b
VVKVWDIVVRVGHWILVAAFVIAYLTEGEPRWLHSWAGYAVGIILVVRVLWGFVGTKHARFSDFVRGPGSVLRYFTDLVRLKAPRFIGHSPAGGAMVIALMLSLAVTTVTGMMVLAVRNGEGPLAPWLRAEGTATIAAPARADSEKERSRDASRERRQKPGRAIKEVHELFANISLILVILHIVGVGLASLAHRENLVRAMISGWKRAYPERGGPRPSNSPTAPVR